MSNQYENSIRKLKFNLSYQSSYFLLSEKNLLYEFYAFEYHIETKSVKNVDSDTLETAALLIMFLGMIQQNIKERYNFFL